MRGLYEAYLQATDLLGVSDVEMPQMLPEMFQEYLNYMGRGCSQRCICITKNGYVGLVPQFTVTGDIMAVVAGAQTPFIVRPVHGGTRESRYQLVGECYIHGIMDGETLASVPWTGIIEVV